MSWAGLVLAIGGLVYLVLPGVTAPDPFGALLMTTAGIAWGGYSLLGRNAGHPMESTAFNFICSVPLAVAASWLFRGEFRVTPAGAWLAVASGTVASALGYFAWYAALKGLPAMRAATVQLCVPVIAAFGGAWLLNESVTARLLLSSAVTLGGIAIVLRKKSV